MARNPQAAGGLPAGSPGTLAGAVDWWDSAYPAGIVSSGSPALVSQVTGRVAGLNWIQGSSSSQPETGTQNINGLNVFNWNRATKSYMTVVVPDTSQPFWLAYVIYVPTTPATLRVIDSFPASAGGRSLICPGNNTSVEAWENGSSTSTYSLSAATPYQVIAQWNGASAVVYVNGASQSTGNTSTGTSGNKFGIGGDASGYLGAWLGDVAFGSGVLDSTNRGIWNTWCARWGL